ncbi:MAG TPA: asparagine synthase, partial [Planctomycetes bacterium]|nr:asparagine synthase [Planctomycetota bacterium]
MLMGNSVEGRFPFLDPELMEFAGSLPPGAKIRGLEEKFLLKKAMGDLLPKSILERPKQPYRAPDALCFFGEDAPDWVEETLSPSSLEKADLFDPKAVGILLEQCRRKGGAGMSHTDNAALVGVLSAMLLHQRLVAGPRDVSPRPGENLVVDRDLSGENPGV